MDFISIGMFALAFWALKMFDLGWWRLMGGLTALYASNFFAKLGAFRPMMDGFLP